MSGLNFNADAAAYTGPFSKFTPAVSRGLVALHFPRLNAEATKRNFKTGGADATIVGIPGYSTGFIITKGQDNFLKLGVEATNAMTWYVAVRNPSAVVSGATQVPVMGDAMVGVNGCSLSLSFVTDHIEAQFRPVVNNSGSPVNGSAANVLVTTGVWSLLVARITGGVGYDLANKTTSLLTTKTEARATVQPTTTQIRVGSWVSSTNAVGTAEIGPVAVYNVQHTDEETSAMAAQFRAQMAKYGITI